MNKKLKEAKKSLELRVGTEVCFSVDDGNFYLGKVLGSDKNNVYLEDVSILNPTKTSHREYVKIPKNKVCAQVNHSDFSPAYVPKLSDHYTFQDLVYLSRVNEQK